MRVFGYCAGLGVLLMSVLPFVAQWFEIRVFPKGFAMPFGCGYLLYPLLGYVLYHGRMTRRWRWMIYLGGLVGMGVHCGVTLYATPEAGAVNLLVKGYLKPPAILQACALFLYVKEALPKLLKKAWMQRLLRFFAPTTFGIYLTHMYAFFFLSSLFDPTTLAFRLCLPPLVFVGLACIIRGVQHLTWARWFLPR
jgi:surface polysaccharide O-acyltransferase-like enzyme